jgi:hypothetical protein
MSHVEGFASQCSFPSRESFVMVTLNGKVFSGENVMLFGKESSMTDPWRVRAAGARARQIL